MKLFFATLLFQGLNLANSRSSEGWKRPPKIDEELLLLTQKFPRHKGPIPVNFDARKKWPKCKSISRIVDQGPCVVSWPAAGVMAMSDRLCIHTQGRDKFQFSFQAVIECCDECFTLELPANFSRCENNACPFRALRFLVEKGAPSDKCRPYNWQTLNESKCEGNCTHKRHLNTLISLSGEGIDLRAVQYEIMTNGPVTSLMHSNDDFIKYGGQNQVYKQKRSGRRPKKFNHNVRILGWGVQNGTPYWLAANTLGKGWGLEGGFFKIRRGKNDLRIEETFVAGLFKGDVEREKGASCASVFLQSEIFCFMFVVYYVAEFYFE